MPGRIRRLAALLALAPFLSGAHCNEDCGPPAVRLVAGGHFEHTLYGPGVFAMHPRVLPLAGVLAPFERRELRLDVSRPVAVVLTVARASQAVARLDGGKLVAGERGDGFKVVALVEQAGKVSLFEDPDALADAERERYDAVVLLPREPSPYPWEASVAIQLGRRTARANDPSTGRCVDRSGAAPDVPAWSLLSLPAHCGDGVRQDDEDCDDGNRAAGDGCGPYCVKER
jgi:cysteine-rich repeat protein